MQKIDAFSFVVAFLLLLLLLLLLFVCCFGGMDVRLRLGKQKGSKVVMGRTVLL